MAKYLDSNGLLYLWQKIRLTFVSDIVWDSTNKKLQKKKKTGTSGAEEATDLVTFAAVATSGSYNDLSNKPTSMTPTSHTHGNIQNGGTLQTSDVSIGNGDKLVIADSSDSSKIARASAAFDGSTTSKYLSKKGTFEDVPAGAFYAEYDSTSYADISAAVTAGRAVFLKISGTNSYLDDLVGVLAASDASAHTFSVTYFSGTSFYVTLIVCDSGSVWAEDGTNIVSDVKVNNVSVVGASGIASLGAAAGKSIVSSISSDSDDLPTVTAVKNYIATSMTGAATFQGDAPTTWETTPPTNYKAGYYWVVYVSGTYAGQTCEPGDMIFATDDYSSSTGYTNSDFEVLQTNLNISSVSNAEIDTIVAS